ncbi:MAG: cupin domain-containing protein [Pseudohongiellaceae bacterium]|nr:cupin domain-containing protein [Pseudohongiellaceae bacterium]
MKSASQLLPKGFDRELFLRQYWQKKPLLIRAQSAEFVDPITAEELAGLACEDCVESRLIIQNSDKAKWELQTGPFGENTFARLENKVWTLLVQAADQWHEGVRSMLSSFDFIPNWRIDDIMISYSTDSGGVGPHFDYYDVFLIQGSGQKRWRLGGHSDSNSQCLPDNSLRLLAEFECEEDWVLNPGDILYIPPNWAHYGTAIGESITYSVGFRAPSIAEVIDDFSHEILAELAPEQRYSDAAPYTIGATGEMRSDAGEQLSALLSATYTDPDRLGHWFARYMTRPKYPELFEALEPPLTPAQFAEQASKRGALLKNPSSRFAFRKLDTHCVLYVDGEDFECSFEYLDILPILCDTQDMDRDWTPLLQPLTHGMEIATSLYNQGSLLFADDYEE